MKRQLLLGAALMGMMAATATVAHAEGKAEAKAAMGECKGINSCKATGDCGGDGHECKGKNSCKGKGWVKMDEKACKDKKGTWTAIKA